jgi:tetratricopeptide (TPR) repeat protein
MDESFYQEGIARAEAQDYQGAIQAFDRAIAHQPDFAEAYYNRGLARFKLGDLTPAIADYSTALRLAPRQVSIYFARGLAYLNRGELQAAIADAEQVIRLQPDHAGAYNLLGNLWQRMEQTGRAIAHYKKAAELYVAQKDVANGRRCLETIQRIKPKPEDSSTPFYAPIDPRGYLKQASEKADQGNYASAIEDLDWAIQIDPQDAEAYAERGRVFEKWGDRHSAVENYETAAKLFAQKGNSALRQSMLDAIQKLKSVPSRNLSTPSYSRSRPATPAPSGRISPQVQDKLRKLVGNDRKIIVDLVGRLRLKHPGMAEDWYWEKAIYDLERDRR